MASKPKNVAKKKNSYEMPKKLKRGMTLVDNFKCEWIVGSSIGKGGFGEIYCVSRTKDKIKLEKDYPYVLKIEPHQNGPLFVEMHFYMRNAKYDDIKSFERTRKLDELGMPHFIGSGSHELQGIKHRFIVMPRYGEDIWNIFLKNGKVFPCHTIYRLALQMINVLEYIHNCTYVHGDLKGANMLMKGDSMVYLVDFGLASHYTTSNEFKPDPKKMHNGTIEYTSIDAHYGVPTMRGDMEILGYNLIHWTGAQLPWEKLLNDPNKVKESKENMKSNEKVLVKKLNIPTCIQFFLSIVYAVNFNERPNYEKCRKVFIQTLSSLGKSNNGPLQFSSIESEVQVLEKKTVESSKKKTTLKDEAVRTKNIHGNASSKATTTKSNVDSSSKDMNSATVLLSTPSKNPKQKYKKVCNVNIDLDISIDTDVVVNVRRKNKATSEVSAKGGSTTHPTSSFSNVVDEMKDSSIPQRSSRKRKLLSNETGDVHAKMLHKDQTISKPVMRAGEYKGKKSK